MSQSRKIRFTAWLFSVLLVLGAVVQTCSLCFSYPKKVTVLRGEDILLRQGAPFWIHSQLAEETVATVSEDAKYEVVLSVFGLLPLRRVEVGVLEDLKLVPCGNTVGIKLFSDGVMVVGTTPVNGKTPASDIAEGDLIIEVNGIRIADMDALSQKVENSLGGPLTLTCRRDKTTYQTTVTPVWSAEEDRFCIGLWVRDSTAGIGTLTFYDPDSGMFGALGHPITDVDTEKKLPVGQGEVLNSRVIGVEKGKRGAPGELKGIFTTGTLNGEVFSNTDVGVFGALVSASGLPSETVEPAGRSEVHVGAAEVLCNVSGERVERFAIQIERVMHQSRNDSKSMVIHITDERLLNQTGGIVQGMSGSPILQDGKLIGAVTHVLVNDPTRGYGVFIENMLSEAGSIR
ncbi:MAG: SpoIVB peptidase [Clostridia bacterium]|nr:SpoIVB peptidase [Clostridia bacterium]